MLRISASAASGNGVTAKRRSISSCALFGSTQVVRLPSEAMILSATADRYAAASSQGLLTFSGKIGAMLLPS